ncbi:hypothetical protein COW36_15050 [bacterium (Candidatus Blackallbacteria) CG17_big_fil_post_rev_8_21_14_2_50_48_46]|uniref:Uncharacterized protein n=1 Tax=bacterium (Candidatus Blackallbacteria) CG17_big_fil_post_rev_8_21_14_2_50_48_46 TaxID=2014261 RepID=A0A2M7G2J1_9BACT|nr:MAG: hypothetical protein COW64_11500 [bacterium (Candidatus Blackallbacteria) CG18_big_fil_WC_8_21_14_2_50_49_26]PIW16027.1 MAG: hypothetical protein COW36_15050 [bacterium (Candidatus Blackallbacteria) CG17_big_fil_post_rev_8_21_14_2_50_48_46]PIW50439.1 MAG: hypothetical protein COW20_02765 [bacterium (Candidatus Blackallbacteria) CG13_big_fil_rev_8_21_14_2_50_49_14]
MPDSAYSEQFRHTLQAVLEIGKAHPDFRFELIQEYAERLKSSQDPTLLINDWVRQLEELEIPRQEAGVRIFEYALLQARQATYRPLNPLDGFIERQLYGIQDEKMVENGTISQILKSQSETLASPMRKAPRSSQPTNPLNPRNLPPAPPNLPPK